MKGEGIPQDVSAQCAEEKGGTMETNFLTVKEVAKYLRLEPLAVYRKVQKNQIPFKRAGRSIRFLKVEIDQWMKWGSP